MDLKNLGARLSELRKKSGLSQRQAAEKLGISPAPLSAYELGKKLPPLETLAAMAELYDVSLDYLCGNEKTDSAAGRQETRGRVFRVDPALDGVTSRPRLILGQG